MKTLKISILALGILAMTACKDSDKRDTVDDNVAVDTPDYNMDNRADDATLAEDAVIADDQYTVFETDNMGDMYDDLEMSQEQINKFEEDYNKKMMDMRNDSTTTLDRNKLQNEKDKSLKSVLTAEQYMKYEEWKKDQPVM